MSISARVKKHISDIRASYWFIPSVLVLAAIILSQATLLIDRNPSFVPVTLSWLSAVNSVEGARSVASVIAQSVIGVAGVMFSITMLAVSFASGQFGPRLIGNFMRDRVNQWTLGILVATFTFALLILRSITDPSEDMTAFVPHVSILIAMALMLISVFVMIHHVHHVPETISVSNIIAGLGRNFIAEIEKLAEHIPNMTPPGKGRHIDVAMGTTGYVHNVAADALSDIATDQNWTVELLTEPGEFVHPGKPTLRVWGAAELSDEYASKLRQFIALGDAKTEQQNVLFVAEQLVEIVGRAMSPGINDPFTAISCMEWLEAGLSRAAKEGKGLTIFPQEGVFFVPLSFERLLNRSLGDCLPYVADDPLTRTTLSTLIKRLEEQVSPLDRTAVSDLKKRLAET